MSIVLNELQKRNLPDLLCDGRGNKINNLKDWEGIMRPYLRDLILQIEFGKLPPYVKPEVTTSKVNVTFAGKAEWERVDFTFTVNNDSHTVPTQLIIPKNKPNCPFIIYLNFESQVPSKYLPIEEIIDSGFAVFSVCYNDISTDNNDFTNGIARLFTKSERKGDDSSKISYWSYMAMRMMDYLKTREEAKNSIIGIGGHSRLGKTALLTGALDERFDFVCSNNSGSSGVALSRCRCEGGEYLRIGFNWFPYWYAPNYEAYVDCAEKLPFDQHALVALVAPRLLLVGAAEKDVWADNDNQFLACVAASPAWELYGKKGLISPDKMPKVGDNLNEGNICFHLREGEHFHSRFDWNVYMQSVKKHFNIK